MADPRTQPDPSWGIQTPGSTNYNPNTTKTQLSGGLESEVGKQMGEEDWREGVGAYGAQQSLDPLQYQEQQRQAYYADPRINQLYGQQQGALGQMGAAGERFQDAAQQFAGGRLLGPQAIGQIRGQAFGQGESLADKYGAVARQQAQGDIAKQAAMSSRGGTDLASRRAAIMGASNVGANMAGQIAASRVQERQQAMQQYLQARQAMRGDQAMGVQGLGQAAGMNVNMAGAYNAPMSQVQTGYGGGVQAGQTDYSQTQTSMGNWAQPPGSGS